jgi:hypothetical protein
LQFRHGFSLGYLPLFPEKTNAKKHQQRQAAAALSVFRAEARKWAGGLLPPGEPD